MTTVLFAPLCPSQPFELSPQQQALQLSRLAVNVKIPPRCEEELHFGFFFDGTRNNADNDRPRSAQSNVAACMLAMIIAMSYIYIRERGPRDHWRDVVQEECTGLAGKPSDADKAVHDDNTVSKQRVPREPTSLMPESP